VGVGLPPCPSRLCRNVGCGAGAGAAVCEGTTVISISAGGDAREEMAGPLVVVGASALPVARVAAEEAAEMKAARACAYAQIESVSEKREAAS
jgi:hypothetical protein